MTKIKKNFSRKEDLLKRGSTLGNKGYRKMRVLEEKV